MLLPASYANGFAPRDGSPLYPSLWKGCVGAWNPGLGVSGLTLRDQSGFNRHGTLTGGPTFAANQGKYALSFDGVDDICSFSALDLRSGNSTYSFWANPSDTSANRGILHGAVWYSGIRYNSGVQYYDTNNANIRVTGSSTLNIWTHVVFTVNNGTLTAYVNGVDTSQSIAAVGLKFDGIGWDYLVSDLGSPRVMQGLLDDVRIYNRALSPKEIRTLATRRGIAYEMAPRRRSSAQVTTNRRRRIIIGGNR